MDAAQESMDAKVWAHTCSGVMLQGTVTWRFCGSCSASTCGKFTMHKDHPMVNIIKKKKQRK